MLSKVTVDIIEIYSLFHIVVIRLRYKPVDSTVLLIGPLCSYVDFTAVNVGNPRKAIHKI